MKDKKIERIILDEDMDLVDLVIERFVFGFLYLAAERVNNGILRVLLGIMHLVCFIPFVIIFMVIFVVIFVPIFLVSCLKSYFIDLYKGEF